MAEVINPIEHELQPVTADNDTTGDTDTANDTDTAPSTKNAASAESPSKVKASQLQFYRNIKRIALVVIAIFVCVGGVVSKVTLVSITGRMFSLVSLRDGNMQTLPQSALFAQLTLILVIPEVVSFVRCLIWGVLGKTAESFPWPSRSAFIAVSHSSNCNYITSVYNYAIM